MDAQSLILMQKVILSRDESAAIKGLLMFLIVLGHNELFCHYFSGIQKYIYSFHIACFFILTFSYPAKTLSAERIKNYIARIYYPYWLFYIFFFIISVFAIKLNVPGIVKEEMMDRSVLGFFTTFFNGGITWVEVYACFTYLWFLPVMFSFSILKDIYNNYAKSRWIIILLAIPCFVVFWLFMKVRPYPKSINHIIEQYSICSIFQALAFLLLSIIAIKTYNSKYKIIEAFVFILLSVYYYFVPTKQTTWILMCILPFVFFHLLVGFKDYLVKSSLFRNIGNFSLIFYIVQTPVCVFINLIVTLIVKHPTLWIIIISHSIIMIVSYYVSYYIKRNKLLNRYVFPSSFSLLIRNN